MLEIFYDARALPYLPNDAAYRVIDLNTNAYYDVIDCVRNVDPRNIEGSLNRINEVLQTNGMEKVSQLELKSLKLNYDKYTMNVSNSIGDINAPYGVIGKAAPWIKDGNYSSKWVQAQPACPF